MSITLVIKGTVEQARAEAKKRQIEVTHLEQGRHGCVTGKCGSRFSVPVVKWFHERHDMATGSGYPAGTLLLYKER